jgi:hypothetical protein
MTIEKLIASIPSGLYWACHNHNPELVDNAAQGVVKRVNSTGWLAITEAEGIDLFRSACEDYRAKYNLL